MAQKVQLICKSVFQGGKQTPSPEALARIWLAMATKQEKGAQRG